MIKSKRLALIAVALTAVASAATASAVVTEHSSSLFPFHRSSGRQPFGPVSAMTRLPPVTTTDPRLLFAIQHGADAMGGDPAAAAQTLRLLATNIGTTHSDLYAYVPSEGSFCFLLWRRQGACSAGSRNSSMRGARLIMSPGGPGYVGQRGDVPPVVAGVVTDEVSAVTLIDGDREIPILIANNAFFHEFEKAQRSALRLTYSDGSTTTVDLQ